MKRKGYDLLAESVRACGTEAFFYLIGGPMTQAMEACVGIGMRGIDVRDERAAAFAAVAYSRVSRRPGVVLSCSGPGTMNVTTGVSHAYTDGAPVVALGGSSPMYQRGTGAFQETDQVSVLRPVTKWAYQVQTLEAIPSAVARAFRVARGGAPGPVYVDLPADVLYADTEIDVPRDVSQELNDRPRTAADGNLVARAVELLATSRRPVVLAGSGVHWAGAGDELRCLVEAAGIPFFTTPIARGLIAEDHPLCLAAARSTAFKGADLLLVLGTRVNYVSNWLQPPVMSLASRVIELGNNPDDLSHDRAADVAILADAKLGLQQLVTAVRTAVTPDRYSDWVAHLREIDERGRVKLRGAGATDAVPIHPLRLCAELERVLPRNAVLVVDGHEILGFSRRAIPAYLPGHMLTPGAYGTMGVGMAFGIGAKVASPDEPVVVLTGDGAFGYHAMELDTAVRHGLGIVVVISNNGGWTGKRDGRPGRDLGFTDYHRIGDAFGISAERISEPSEIGPALRNAFEFAARERKPALVNVIVAPEQNAGRAFIQYQRGSSSSEYGPA